MPTITGPWTYRTPTVTIDYPAGEHEVAPEIAAVFTGPAQPDALDLSIRELAAEVAKVTDLAVIEAMLSSETAGKTRKGAIDVLEARRAQLEDDGS